METPWREVVEKTHLGVWILDGEDCTTYVNDRLTALLGLTPQEILGRWVWDLLGSPQNLRLCATLKQNLPLVTDFCFQRPDGKSVYLLLAANALPVQNAASQGTLIMVADITERKLVEELLWRQAHIVEQIQDAVISVDLEKCITSWNRGAQRLFGYTADEMLGQPFALLSLPEQAEIFSAEVMTSLEQKSMHERELWLQQKNGTALYVHLSMSPLKNREGQLCGGIVSARDITKRKLLEEDLIRTARLESASVLASGIAHDFNNMLTAILGNITMAFLNAENKGFVQERLAEAEKACFRAQNLARQLLTFSNREEPKKRLLSLHDVLKTSASLVLRSSNVRRQAEIPADLWWVEADEEQLNQAINHLLINADQAMPRGGTIYITAENVTLGEDEQLPLKPGPYVKVAIRDRGVGIPPAYLAKVFDPFFTTKSRGNGLGLATVYTILKNHDGHITVTSQPETGTTFTFYLPAVSQAAKPRRAKAPALRMGRGRVLLMDDEEMILEVSSAMLKRLGYEVWVSQDGAAALEIYRQASMAGSPFDVVILDLTVPGGLEAKETVGPLLQVNPQAKIIVSSGFADDPSLTDFRSFGFAGFLPKPYNLTQLSAVMHKVLQ
ncbi:MAG: hybrid sensor histidine kinase/response regulator [Desulfobacca sp.]|uniref:hybrid sensor histidine kinase/response regulator n=1 Tax=Desulfobacca sp. TaxID=2067990 RepID=UPI004048F2A5